MSASSVCVVGTDSTMVYDALHGVVDDALDGLDPALCLTDLTARDAAGSGERVGGAALEALNTPGLLAERRVVVIRDAQLLVADEVDALVSWISSPSATASLIVAVVGAKSNRLAKACDRLVETNVGSGARPRAAFVEEKLAQYGVGADGAAVAFVAERVGDDVARVDSLARTLRAIYGTAPLTAAQIEPYVGDAGAVPAWDLTDAIDRGDAPGAIVAARRMLDSKDRAGLQVVNILQRHYLAMTRLEGSGVRGRDDAAALLSMSPYPAEKVLRTSQRLGAERIAQAVRWVTGADLDLKGAVTYGTREEGEVDPTEVTVVEVLVARLARMTRAAARG
ncbi:MAG: DNA polymerase III subunit delta [Acidimicrobiales bacterium]